MRACTDVFVYFKHEDKSKGPVLARLLSAELAAWRRANATAVRSAQ